MPCALTTKEDASRGADGRRDANGLFDNGLLDATRPEVTAGMAATARGRGATSQAAKRERRGPRDPGRVRGAATLRPASAVGVGPGAGRAVDGTELWSAEEVRCCWVDRRSRPGWRSPGPAWSTSTRRADDEERWARSGALRCRPAWSGGGAAKDRRALLAFWPQKGASAGPLVGPERRLAGTAGPCDSSTRTELTSGDDRRRKRGGTGSDTPPDEARCLRAASEEQPGAAGEERASGLGRVRGVADRCTAGRWERAAGRGPLEGGRDDASATGTRADGSASARRTVAGPVPPGRSPIDGGAWPDRDRKGAPRRKRSGDDGP